MDRTHTTRAGRIAAAVLAVLAWAALLLQLALAVDLSLDRGGSVFDALLLFFGYFTVLSNLFVALSASAQALAPASRLAAASARGCATTAIVLVGIGYHLLLRDVWDPQGWQWVADILLHYAVPAAALLHWLAFPPARRPAAAAPLVWAAYPVAYTVYALLRGLWLESYPYPFIDVATIGYARACANAAGLCVVFVIAGALLRLAARPG